MLIFFGGEELGVDGRKRYEVGVGTVEKCERERERTES